MCSAIEPNTDRLRSKNASLLDRVAVRSFAKLIVGTLILFAVGQVVCSVADGRGSSLEIRRIIDMIDQERRNNAIRKCFYEQLGKGTPVMEAYSMTGKQFYLSEERVRQIVAKRKSR